MRRTVKKDLLIANLQSQLAYLKNKVFGSTSEIRHDQLDGQLNLFGTPVGDEKACGSDRTGSDQRQGVYQRAETQGNL